MKKISFSLALISTFNILISQVIFNRGYHSTNEVVNSAVVNIGGNYYHTVRHTGLGYTNQAFLYKHSASGTLKFVNNVFTGRPLSVNALFKTNDNALVLVCGDYVCNIYSSFSNTITSHLIKIDTSGNEVFKTSVNRSFIAPLGGGDVVTYLGDNFKYGFQNTDNSYCVFTDSVMYKFSSGGQVISKKNLGVDSITSVLLLANNDILVNARAGLARKLIILSPAGVIQSAKSFSAPLKKIQFYSGAGILGLGSDGRMYKISPNLDLIASSNATVGLKVSDIVCENDTIYSVINNQNTTSAYSSADTSFINYSYTSLPTMSLVPAALCKSGSRLGMIATSVSDEQNSLGQNYFSSISVYDKNSAPVHASNVELSSAVIDTAFYTSSSPNPYTVDYVLQIRFRLKVKNKGTTTLTNFKFTYANDLYSGQCGGREYAQQLYSGLSIQPGDSITFTSALMSRFVSQYNSFPAIPHNHCAFLTLPNGEVDKDQSDNEKCVVETFGGLGINTIDANFYTIKVFPNPFADELTISSDLEIKTIEVLNGIGILISKTLVNARSASVVNGELKPGIYFIKIETEKGSAIRKMIKQ